MADLPNKRVLIFSATILCVIILGIVFVSLEHCVLEVYCKGPTKEVDIRTQDLNSILSGISKVEERANNGILTIYGENAIAILSGKSVGNTLRPILGAGRLGAGRFVVFTHSSCFLKAYEIPENDKLFANVASWVTGGQRNISRPTPVGGKKGNITAALYVAPENEEGFQRVLTNNGLYQKNDVILMKDLENLETLKKYDLLILNHVQNVNNITVENLKEFVSWGGGLVLGATPWAAQENKIENNSTFRESFWGNKILGSLGGIAFAEGHAQANTKPGAFYNTSKLFLEDTHAGMVSENLERILERRQTIHKQKYRQIFYILNDRSLYAPENLTFSEQLPNLMEKLHELIVEPTVQATQTAD